MRRMLWEMESAEAAAHSQEDEDHSADGHTWTEEPRRQTATVRPWVLGPLFCQPVAWAGGAGLRGSLWRAGYDAFGRR